MSLPTTSSETLGHLSDETVVDPNSKTAKAISGKSPMRIALGRLLKDKIAVVCAIVAFLFVLVGVFAGVISDLFGVSLDVNRPSLFLDFTTGLPNSGPPNHGFDSEHPFGLAPRTADDNLAYWVHGCRTSLVIAGSATLIASVSGIVIGLVAGFMGGIVDRVLSFVIDVFLTIPYLLAALTLAPIISERFATSPNYATIQRYTLVAILAALGWMGVARLIRGEVLSLREREFVQAARVLGMPTRRILVKELLPNLTAPIVVAVSLMLPAFVAAEAGLAFLGIGVTSGASWGQTITKAVPYFDTYPLYLYEPLVGITLLVLSLNLLGDAIRDAVDPKTRR
jgi:ABC-type dipeptide/oligopeptide/nickel transport system permease subunit